MWGDGSADVNNIHAISGLVAGFVELCADWRDMLHAQHLHAA